MSGGVDMSPKRSSCSTGWMSRRNRNILYLSSYYNHYNRDIMFNVKFPNRAGVLTWIVFTSPSMFSKAAFPF